MVPAPAEKPASSAAPLWLFLLANYAVAVVLCAGFVPREALGAPETALWIAAVWLTYPLFYLLPAFALGWIGHRLLARLAGVAAFAPAIAAFAAVQLGLLADLRIHALYGFHLNGFVWNLVTTRGGIESLGAGAGTLAEAGVVAAFALAAQALLLAGLARAARGVAFLRSRAFAAGFLACIAVLSVSERIVYAGAQLRDYGPLLQWSGAFPFYLPLRVDRLARRIGVPVAHAAPLRAGLTDAHLSYPRAPIAFRPDAPRWNVVVLCAESLRADALDPERMPATWRFAEGATRFAQHVSAGNGTRMGVFGLFYGLPGPYWFKLLDRKRGPALIRALLERGYDVRGFTSDKFSYPEFDRTVFADVPREALREGGGGPGWKRDREQVGAILDYLAARDRARPFFLYMFFESPHAPYEFPPETAVRTPYLDDLDYLTMDLTRDIEKIENRYWNAVRHLDTQLDRVFAALETEGLLDSTIVVVTGDHGEEFLEKGRWGHNSEFDEEQIRVPLALHAPGRAPAVIERLTSHLDLPATLLTLLGATNPPSDYSLGESLLEAPERPYVLVSDWSRVAYVDAEGKATFPMQPQGWFKQSVTDRRDAPVPDPGAWLRARTPAFGRVLSDLARFARGPELSGEAGAPGR